MSQSLANIIVHIVFSTKNRLSYLDDKLNVELYSYVAHILKKQNCNPLRIGGTGDHIHILCTLSKSISAAKLIEKIKTVTSKWIKTKDNKFNDFYWQNGYGIFSISPSHIENVLTYISNQKQHHAKISFQEELRKLLNKYNLPYDERYLWN